jgi:hypothetical protein
MNVVGYNLDGQDNNTYMFPPGAVVERCSVCNYRRDLLAYNPNYVLQKADADVSTTYDGFLIVSGAFRKFCVEQGYRELVFGEFLQDKRHYDFNVKRSVKFDAVRRGTIIGATPSYLLIEEPLEDGFYRGRKIFWPLRLQPSRIMERLRR